MDDRDISVEISKINFLLENLYALYLRDMGVSHDQIPAFADEMVRQAVLPGTTYGPGSLSKEEQEARQDLLEHRLAMFASGVRDRLASDQGRARPQ